MSVDRPDPADARTADAAQSLPALPAAEDASFTLNPDSLPEDNAPTIISKAVPAKGAANGQFTNLVRGRKLAHFELEEPIGVGGMAAVIRARDLHLDRPVALKVLPPEMAADPENVRRFEHESRAAAKLDHENIARVYYCGQDKGLHFIAFEFVEGENLKGRIQRLGCIPVAEAIHYVLQIASGLAHAAARGVVHRDIKPSNIIIGENGRAKLVDMGLARSLDKPPQDELTHSGVTLGTFDYISPEQALEPRSADVRSDIYSLGCTLYQMLTGQPPVPEGTAARKLKFHQSESPLDPRHLNPEIPDEVAAILARMMAKEPKDRYQRPDVLVQHLLSVAGKLSGGSSAVARSDVLFVDSILPSPPRIRPMFVMAAGALLVIVLIAILGPYLTSDSTDTGTPGFVPPSGANSDGPRTATLPGSSKNLRDVPKGMPATPHRVVKNVQELRELSGEEREGIVLLEDGVYDLSALAGDGADTPGGLTFSNCNLTLQAQRDARPVLRWSGRGSGERTPAALTIAGGQVVLAGIRFELDQRGETAGPVALAVRGGHVVCRDCEFSQQFSNRTAASPTVKTARAGAPLSAGNRVEFRHCIFYGGGRALDLDDTEWFVVEHCAFGEYDEPIHLKGSGAGKTLATIAESSFLVGSGPFLWADSRRTLQIDLSRCVCSHLAADDAQPLPALFVFGHDQFERCRLQSQDNCFHRLGALVARLNEEGVQETVAVKPSDLAKLPIDSHDAGSLSIEETPWQDPDPIQRLASATRESALEAFRLKTKLAALRRSDAAKILGPLELVGQPLYANLEPIAGDASSGTPRPNFKELFVDGVGGQPGTYPNLASALSAADYEDEVEVVITIKWSGPLQVRPLELGSRRMTIRAAAGFTPELAFHPDSDPGADGDAALFRVRDGSLTLENLRFRIQPTLKENAKLQSLLAVTGTGRGRLKSCLATLVGSDDQKVALASVADPTGAMMGMGGKTPRAGIPALELEDCLVRGQGDLITVRASRPYRLDVKNALVVLNGSFLSVEGNKREATMPTDGAMVSLERVTAFVSQHLVLLHATAERPLHVPLRVSSATTCLFASAEENPLLRVDGPDSEQELKRRLTWQGKKNFYSTAGSILVWQPLGMGEMPHKYDRDRWGDLWGPDDDQPRFTRGIRFAGYPAGDKTPLDITPSDFRIATADALDPELAHRGADLDKLPQPGPVTPAEQE
jgi:serine/threonine protein kinase